MRDRFKFASMVFIVLFGVELHAGYQAYFSPIDDLDVKVQDELQKARKKIDVSIYTFRSEPIKKVLLGRLKAGVKVRLLVRPSKLPQMIRFMGSLTKAGAEVRFVTKTNHHKFAIVDGHTLLNSSGNFNDSWLQKSYDENLLVCDSCRGLIGHFQNEFDFLFRNSNKLGKKNDVIASNFSFVKRKLTAGLNAIFTSYNFFPFFNSRTKKISFKSKSGISNVVDRLVLEIDKAKRTIQVATGHFRSYKLYKALVRAHTRGVDVQLMVDSQEYITKYWQEIEDERVKKCTTGGDSQEFCTRSRVHFARKAHKKGLSVRVKYYALKWAFPRAPQMHHKYMIVDERRVLTGSYNWSNNAEVKMLENVAIIDDLGIVADYMKNFSNLRNYGHGQFDVYRKKLINAKLKLPVYFLPMALDFRQVDVLRELACKKCPNLFCKSTMPVSGSIIPKMCQLR